MVPMDEIEQHANLFKALSDPTRLKLIRLLGENAARSGDEATECSPPHECDEHGFLCVNALAHRLGVTQSAVSQHLRILKNLGLVKGERRGYNVHYAVDHQTLERLHDQFFKALIEEKKE